MIRIVAVAFVLFCVQTVHSDALSTERSVNVFEQLKNQEGMWRGKSTKGWENRQQVKVIAKGTVVMFTSEFVDSAHEGMATMFYLENGNLFLTHYCEAGNQPTLKAVAETADGILFEFVRGTNVPDRNTGHMDKVIIRLRDQNRYSSQWTWYANGKEQWLEDIEYERVR